MNKFLRAVAKDSSLFGKVVKQSLKYIPLAGRDMTLEELVMLGQVHSRTHYAYCLMRAAELASRLGYKAVSALEFGVAGGNGLVALEEIKAIIEEYIPIEIKIYGFDLGSGLPSSVDYRDLPYHWQSGFYEMDIAKLKTRLKSAELIIGPIAETVPEFVLKPKTDAPIGMIAFDLDYYSSTKDALKIFDIPQSRILPRVLCYMDDIIGTVELYSDFTGVRLAISEFNNKNVNQKISRCYDFYKFPIERWQDQIMVFHDFAHPLYDHYVGSADMLRTQLPLG